MKTPICVFFICFSIFLNAQYKNFWKPVDREFDALLNRIDSFHIIRPNLNEQKEIVTKMYFLAEKRKNNLLLSRAMQWDAFCRINNSRTDSTELLLEKAVYLIDTTKYSYDYARIKSVKEKLLKNKGDYLGSYKICTELIDYYKKLGDNRSLGMSLIQMGITLFLLKDYEKSLEFFEEANFIFTEIGMESIAEKTQLNICNVLYYQGFKKEATLRLDKLLESRNPEIIQDTAFIINALLSRSYFADSLEIKWIITKNYHLAQNFKNKPLKVKTGANYASMLIDEGRYSEAIDLLNKISSCLKETNDMNAQLSVYKNKLSAYSKQKIWDSAYYYSDLYYSLNDSLMGLGKIVEIKKIEEREAINKFEQEKKESELKRRNTLLLLFAVCCLSMALISIIYFRNKKTKVQKQLKEVENKELNERLKNELLQKENLKIEIDSKNRELTSNTLLLTEKNRILENLAHQIKELEFKGQLATKEEKELQKQIQDHLQTANEWEYFKLHFESVHTDFFSKLKEYSNSISENDLRLCAYIRIGMETKQIAQMLSVLPATINTSRYRIRKKLNIVGDISLEDFLRSL